MAYNLGWGSNHPGCLVYLIDMSGSMSQNSRMEYVTETVKEVSEYLVSMCEKGGTLLNRFHIKIFGYNTDVFKLFDGSVVDLDAKLEEAYVKNVSLFDTFDNKDKVKPQWQTYTAKAFRKVAEETKEWVKRQQNNQIPVPAPIIIHVTDGHPEEKERVEALAISDALSAAQDIKSIAVPDGNALLFNIHITDIAGKTLRFPSVSPNGNDKDAARLRFLFDASSEMTDMFVARANAFKLNAQSRSRFMVSNEHDRNILAKLIAFGSSVTSVGGEFVELPKY
jgi:uncharacterized protein YegL